MIDDAMRLEGELVFVKLHRIVGPMICFALILATVTAWPDDDKSLLKRYRGDIEIPQDLYATYERFVRAIRKGDEEAIKKICLPHVVDITRDPRPKETAEYGRNINLPFGRHGFDGDILLARNEENGAIQLRTGTSYLHFVETIHSTWRLYDYGDNPIQ